MKCKNGRILTNDGEKTQHEISWVHIDKIKSKVEFVMLIELQVSIVVTHLH